MFLDSDNTHCTEHYDDLLKEILSKYKRQLNEGNLVLMTYSGHGSSLCVEKLAAVSNLKFVTKGYSTVTASKIAKDIPYSDYLEVDKCAWVYELNENNGLRNIIVQI